MTESWYHYNADRSVLTLAPPVQPDAKRTEVAGLHGVHLKVRIAASAADDKANVSLADSWRTSLTCRAGGLSFAVAVTGAPKTVEIYGQAASLLARVKILLHS